MTTPPPIQISDETMEAAIVAAENCGCDDRGYWSCCIRRAVEAVAPLIAAQVLRGVADQLRTEAATYGERRRASFGNRETTIRQRALEDAAAMIEKNAPGRSLTEDAP